MSIQNPPSERGEITKQKLEDALQRLIEGHPERTPNDGKLNLSRINKEAGLSSGGIYYYDDFVERARREIGKHKSIISTSSSSKIKVSVDRLRAQRDKERELKERYRSQRDEIKKFCDLVIAQNAKLEFSLYEALEEIEALQAELNKVKVVGFERGKQN
ncbi:hypothetical protein [Vreelandella neptunia]|uniref:Uncharacterized protein n=1 Tax=Vreelandella neptunia TaxID=115551 RepID=A0ABZ0YSE2_9GAMM|nr:hypothetical protein [Halomonas neptunia]MDN3561610.1 hypothetical protein [Halomonas neptunia]WQH14514.1 hypothetical protein SR894_08215 [Halomonas neptunia]